MQQAPVVDMAGTCDLHIHPGPDIFVRIADDLGIAQMARNAGQRAILLKCHVENTASRAYHVQQLVPEVKIFGSIVLNWFVGGLNPVGVEAALRMGAKEVFMAARYLRAGRAVRCHPGHGAFQPGRNVCPGPGSAGSRRK
jgi:hypothetical protein